MSGRNLSKGQDLSHVASSRSKARFSGEWEDKVLIATKSGYRLFLQTPTRAQEQSRNPAVGLGTKPM
jgi:hypothetical protein